MRSDQVHLHLRCNQNCTYCTTRRPNDDPAFVRAPAVLLRVREAIAAGARELVLGGGEPTLRRDLAQIVLAAKAAGAERLALETNATELDAERARELREAGLDRALVNLAGDGPWLDAVTRDPGGFERTSRGIAALLAAGIAVDVQIAIVRSTLERASLLPAFLRTRFGASPGVRSLYVTVPTSAPDERELLDYDVAGAAIRALDDASRQVALPLELAPGSGPPPCVHGPDVRVAHVYSMTPGGAERPSMRRVPECDACAVRDRCPGMDSSVLDRFGAPRVVPIRSERTRRRLSLISTVADQVARELVQLNRHHDPRHGMLDESLVRVVFQCNQACRFCFVSTHLPAASDEAVERAIREAGVAGRKITLTGGEPTLHPRLPDLVRLARSVSTLPVAIQTNAVRLGDVADVRALKDAGLDEAFVSLHGATAAISDAITHAPATFERTVRGIDRLLEVGIAVQINFVICGENAHELPAWVDLLAERWPRATAIVSFVATSTDVVPRDASMMPRYADVLPHLALAVERADARGVLVSGFESMCGIPRCLVPDSGRRWTPEFAASPDVADGEFVKTGACAGCSLSDGCWGVRRGYVELYGDAELRPVRARAAGST